MLATLSKLRGVHFLASSFSPFFRAMLKSYLLVSLRALRRQPGYGAINVLGLSIGLACSFFILLWVSHQVRFDRFHEQQDQLFAARQNITFGDGQIQTWTSIPVPAAAALEEQVPEILDAEVVLNGSVVMASGATSHRAEGYWADDAFFEMFSFPLLEGEASTTLSRPDGMVLSDAFATKMFGANWRDLDILGRSVRVDDRADFQVMGVAAAAPETSSFQFDFVLPAADYYAQNTWLLEDWGSSFVQLYVRLAPGTDHEALNTKLASFIGEQTGSENSPELFLAPFGDGHLYGEFENGHASGGRIEYVWAFLIVAGLVLLIACINFMNLATAQAGKRAKGIGVRKSIGAKRVSLTGQLLMESTLLALVAFVVALGMVVLLLPAFSRLAGVSFELGEVAPFLLLAGLTVALVTGFVAGSYPAFYIASFNPVTALRGSFQQGARTVWLRKGLVVVQFALSTFLIVGTLTVYLQMNYIQQKKLGLDRENMVQMRLEGPAQQGYESFRQELLRRPGIQSVTASNTNPLSVESATSAVEWEGKEPGESVVFHYIGAQHDFLETMGMELAEGRSFSRNFSSDSGNVIINERAAQAMGLENPLGKQVALWEGLAEWEQSGEIIGVVKDFHIASLHAEIEPMLVRLDPGRAGMLLVRTEAGMTPEALASLEAVHAQFNGDSPFDYEFLDANYEEMYRSEIMVGALSRIFALIAILVACLGLFGLAAFTAEQRKKEIGVRKVLGASVADLVSLLTKDFVVLIGLAFVIAAPIAYIAGSRWLDGFAYRIGLGPWPFVLAGALLLGIALATVSSQAFRAATVDPVRALRSE
ncbi:MAG: ABC transporter permease [Rubricoccaceae bacterium]